MFRLVHTFSICSLAIPSTSLWKISGHAYNYSLRLLTKLGICGKVFEVDADLLDRVKEQTIRIEWIVWLVKNPFISFHFFTSAGLSMPL